MRSIRTVARVLTGSTYAILGYNVARSPGELVHIASGTLTTLRRIAPLPMDDELIVRGNAAVQVLGGSLLALGVMPGLSAAVLAASLIPTSIAGHGYWNEKDPTLRKLERIQFQKNLAMLGGLAFAYLDARHSSASRPPKTVRGLPS